MSAYSPVSHMKLWKFASHSGISSFVEYLISHHFFQGLERHLLGSHGLVTASMQDLANKGQDSGRCPVCGKVLLFKIVKIKTLVFLTTAPQTASALQFFLSLKDGII